jgi:hypothetical protein
VAPQNAGSACAIHATPVRLDDHESRDAMAAAMALGSGFELPHAQSWRRPRRWCPQCHAAATGPNVAFMAEVERLLRDVLLPV